MAVLLAMLVVAASVAAPGAAALAEAVCTMPGKAQTGVRGDAYRTDREIRSPDACCAACVADAPQCVAWVLQSNSNAEPPSCRLKPGTNGSAGATYPCPLCPFSGMAPPPPRPKCPAGPDTSHPTTPPTLSAGKGPNGARPHVLMFLQDDLGHDDVAFNGNEVNLDVTGNITAAARDGIILRRHYVHWHCSPTRRTFLTGRLPLHHSEFLSPVSTGDDIDLRWTTIGQKLKTAGYKTYWFGAHVPSALDMISESHERQSEDATPKTGKGHTGYKSFHHLPLQLGFDAFEGFLGGAQDHFALKRWRGNCPWQENTTYSAELYGSMAHETLAAYDPHAAGAAPLFFYLPWQNVRQPATRCQPASQPAVVAP
jgi:hypothetical protein